MPLINPASRVTLGLATTDDVTFGALDITGLIDAGTLDVAGHSAFGADASVNPVLYIMNMDETYTHRTGTKYGFWGNIDSQPSDTLTGTTVLMGADIQTEWNAGVDGSTNGYMIGIKGEGNNIAPSQAVKELTGVYGIGGNFGGGAVTNAYGVRGDISNNDGLTYETGNVTKGSSLVAGGYTDKGSGIIVTRYGLEIEDVTGGGLLTNQYGIYCPALAAGGTANLFIKNISADSDFGSGDITTTGLVSAGTLSVNNFGLTVEAASILNQDLTSDASPAFATVKLSGLTDDYIPYHVNDATGLANGPTKTNVDSAVSLKHTQGTDTTLGTLASDVVIGTGYKLRLNDLTDGYIPKHTSDAVGLADSLLLENASGVGSGVTPAVRLHVGGTLATDIIRTDIGLDFNPVVMPASHATLTASAGAGLADGAYYYGISYITAIGETNIHNAMGPVTCGGGNNKVTLTSIPVSTDYRVTGRKIYRSTVGGSTAVCYLVTTLDADDTSYIDSTPDGSLTGANVVYRSNTTCNQITVNDVLSLRIDEYHTALGVRAGDAVTGGGYNCCIGADAGTAITTASYNTCIGGQSGLLLSTTGAGSNTMIGFQAGRGKSGNFNVIVGYDAGYGTGAGAGNVHIGKDAGFGNTSGNYNVCIGLAAGYTSTTTAQSVLIGYQAGYYETAANTLVIDYVKRGANQAAGPPLYLIYGTFAATAAAQSLRFNAAVIASESLTIGVGTAETDYTLTFDGETNNGVLTWMEDEDYFQFADGVLIPTGEQIYFRDTAINIASGSDGWLNLVADTGVEVNAPVLNVATLYSAGAFGCNGKGVQTAYPCAAWDEPGAGAFGVDSAAHMAALVELVKDMQAALVANGIMAVV